jgi:Holliday junction resolvasome RuvABC endonuclease subunit
MKILAFDLGTNTGVAIGDASERPLAHTERLGEAGQSHGARFAQALHMTRRLIEQHSPDLIAFEAPIAAGPKGAASRVQLSMGIRACIMAMAHLRSIETMEVPVQSIRKHFIGAGDLKREAAKQETIRRCRALGWHVVSDDQADACAVWDYARNSRTKISSPPPNGLFDARDHQDEPTGETPL